MLLVLGADHHVTPSMPQSLAHVRPIPKGQEAPGVVRECGIWSWTDLDSNPSRATWRKLLTPLYLRFLISKQEMTHPTQEELDDVSIRAQNLVGAQKTPLCLCASLLSDLGPVTFFETRTCTDDAQYRIAHSCGFRWPVTSTQARPGASKTQLTELKA